ncbi:unnamed protein product, partial [Laminaria digitata]
GINAVKPRSCDGAVGWLSSLERRSVGESRELARFCLFIFFGPVISTGDRVYTIPCFGGGKSWQTARVSRVSADGVSHPESGSCWPRARVFLELLSEERCKPRGGAWAGRGRR